MTFLLSLYAVQLKYECPQIRMRFLTNNRAHLVPSKGLSSTCVRYLLVRRRRICARGNWTRVGPPSRGYPPTHRTRPDVQSHLWACTLHTHMHLYVQARTCLCAQIHTGTHTLSMLHLAVHTLPTHLLILAIRKQCLSNAMGESPSFYLLIDIGHKYFGSCENVAVVKVNYLLRGGLSTGIWTNCVQIWDKIRDGGSIYIADDSAPPFFLIAFGWWSRDCVPRKPSDLNTFMSIIIDKLRKSKQSTISQFNQYNLTKTFRRS